MKMPKIVSQFSDIDKSDALMRKLATYLDDYIKNNGTIANYEQYAYFVKDLFAKAVMTKNASIEDVINTLRNAFLMKSEEARKDFEQIVEPLLVRIINLGLYVEALPQKVLLYEPNVKPQEVLVEVGDKSNEYTINFGWPIKFNLPKGAKFITTYWKNPAQPTIAKFDVTYKFIPVNTFTTEAYEIHELNIQQSNDFVTLLIDNLFRQIVGAFNSIFRDMVKETLALSGKTTTTTDTEFTPEVFKTALKTLETVANPEIAKVFHGAIVASKVLLHYTRHSDLLEWNIQPYQFGDIARSYDPVTRTVNVQGVTIHFFIDSNFQLDPSHGDKDVFVFTAPSNLGLMRTVGPWQLNISSSSSADNSKPALYKIYAHQHVGMAIVNPEGVAAVTMA